MEQAAGAVITHQDLMKMMKDDANIQLMKYMLECIFGGLWCFLLFTLALSAKDTARILIWGFKDNRERRQLHYLDGRQNQISILIFVAIVVCITGFFVFLEEGRVVLSRGFLLFLIGGMVYMVFCRSSRHPGMNYDSFMESAKKKTATTSNTPKGPNKSTAGNNNSTEELEHLKGE